MVQKLANIAEKAFQPCSYEQAFRFANGTVSHTLPEFCDHLRSVDVGTLEYHRGHFHFWIHDVLGDKTLATRIKMLGERRELRGEELRENLVGTLDERLTVLEAQTGQKRARSTKSKNARSVPVRRRSS